jgi:hypothetical protein
MSRLNPRPTKIAHVAEILRSTATAHSIVIPHLTAILHSTAILAEIALFPETSSVQ